MGAELNELAAFAAVTAVGIGCALIVDASPVRWCWSLCKLVTAEIMYRVVIVFGCFLLASDDSRDDLH